MLVLSNIEFTFVTTLPENISPFINFIDEPDKTVDNIGDEMPVIFFKKPFGVLINPVFLNMLAIFDKLDTPVKD